MAELGDFESFKLPKDFRVRRNTDYIILVPSLLFRDKVIPPDGLVLDSGPMYTWNIWEKYFLHKLGKESLPCHYYFDKVGKDYVTIVGQNEMNPSYFIDDLVQASIINYKYLNSIVIMIGEDFNKRGMNRRMLEQLVCKLLIPLMKRFKLNKTRIKFIDECFLPNWEDSLKYSKLRYTLTESSYFDINFLTQFINKYNIKTSRK